MRTMVAVMVSSVAWLAGCGLSHGEGNTSGSNWLRCQKLTECKVPEAVSCSARGYCTDQHGERIAAPTSGLKDAQETVGCALTVDAILAKAPVTSGQRRACGSFDLDSTAEARRAGLRCFDDARQKGQAAEFTVTRCDWDCKPDTYVATGDGRVYEVFQREEPDANEREAVLKSCSSILLLLDRDDFYCANEAQLYQCVEPISATPPSTPIQTPMKLSDAPNPDNAPTVTVHLYASNQSFDEPLTSFFVRIDDKRVILGDFPVGSQHSWYNFDIQVPLGTHRLDAYSEGGAVFMQDIDVAAERWLVVDYWRSTGDTQGHFTLHESATQVAFAARTPALPR